MRKNSACTQPGHFTPENMFCAYPAQKRQPLSAPARLFYLQVLWRKVRAAQMALDAARPRSSRWMLRVDAQNGRVLPGGLYRRCIRSEEVFFTSVSLCAQAAATDACKNKDTLIPALAESRVSFRCRLAGGGFYRALSNAA